MLVVVAAVGIVVEAIVAAVVVVEAIVAVVLVVGIVVAAVVEFVADWVLGVWQKLYRW